MREKLGGDRVTKEIRNKLLAISEKLSELDYIVRQQGKALKGIRKNFERIINGIAIISTMVSVPLFATILSTDTISPAELTTMSIVGGLTVGFTAWILLRLLFFDIVDAIWWW